MDRVRAGPTAQIEHSRARREKTTAAPPNVLALQPPDQ